MEKKAIENLVPVEGEEHVFRGVRLYATKIDLVPSWLTEELSVNPYFGAAF